VEPEAVIVCVDCGGRAHLLTSPPEDGRWEPGEIVAYRCADCLDRWDLVLPDEPDE
jgi:DNA-directed RNA polymerase subunit RPC12/RpoP